MPIKFKLTGHFVGFAGSAAKGGETVQVIYREYLAPADPNLQERLDHLHRGIFAAIPGLPPVSSIDHLLVVIAPDLSAKAYVNELNIKAMIRPNRAIKAGEAVRVADIEDIDSVQLGVAIPPDHAFILVRSFEWRRSVIYDTGPLQDEPIAIDYPLEKALAQQQLLLLGLAALDEGIGETRLDRMKRGLAELDELIAGGVSDESKYQELLEEHPWMLGGTYDRVERHAALDDERIPDFTARRNSDLYHDVVEIKHPFITLFKKGDKLAAGFNDAWNQAEGYVTFAQRHRSYLREEKGLAFENPRALLLVGHNLTEQQRKVIREKESLAPLITVRTYDELRRVAAYLVELVETADQRPVELEE